MTMAYGTAVWLFSMTPPRLLALCTQGRIQSPSNTSARSQLMRSCILTGLCIQKAGM